MIMINMFRYEVIYSLDNGETEEKASGFVFGNTVTDAVKNLENYYGEDELCSLKVTWEEDTDSYVIEDNKFYPYAYTATKEN